MAKTSSFQKTVSSMAGEVAERPPLRINPKAEDPRERATRRAAQIRDHLGGLDEGTDEFFVPSQMIPDMWTYEWKRHTIYNQEDPAYTVQLAREGWEVVPVDRCPSHRAMMPATWTKNTIERKGMVLMERPTDITFKIVWGRLRVALYFSLLVSIMLILRPMACSPPVWRAELVPLPSLPGVR